MHIFRGIVGTNIHYCIICGTGLALRIPKLNQIPVCTECKHRLGTNFAVIEAAQMDDGSIAYSGRYTIIPKELAEKIDGGEKRNRSFNNMFLIENKAFNELITMSKRKEPKDDSGTG